MLMRDQVCEEYILVLEKARLINIAASTSTVDDLTLEIFLLLHKRISTL